MQTATAATAGIWAYSQIPARTIHSTVDSMFPRVAILPLADIPPFGRWHRFREGHDLLIDVPRTFIEHGPHDGINHVGHIVLTDLPTRDGIPLPGLSGEGFGSYLLDLGVTRDWLTINIVDGLVGYLAISEGTSDLIAAAAGDLDMSVTVFFDTFVEGGIEIALGGYFHNPFLVFGGVENIAAGIVSTWKTIVVNVPPVDLLGAGLACAIAGGVLTYTLTSRSEHRERARTSITAAARSGAIGALGTVQAAFGMGGLLAVASYGCGNLLATARERELRRPYNIDAEDVDRFVCSQCENDVCFDHIWRDSSHPTGVLSTKHAMLSAEPSMLDSHPRLPSHSAQCLPSDGPAFDCGLTSELDTRPRCL